MKTNNNPIVIAKSAFFCDSRTLLAGIHKLIDPRHIFGEERQVLLGKVLRALGASVKAFGDDKRILLPTSWGKEGMGVMNE